MLTARRQQIGQYLGIHPTSHGQLYTCQLLYTPTNSSAVEVAKKSLARHGSNLGAVVVVREGEDYRVLIGAEWVQAAEELGIERLWVNVLDSADEIEEIKAELGALAPKVKQQPQVAQIKEYSHPKRRDLKTLLA